MKGVVVLVIVALVALVNTTEVEFSSLAESDESRFKSSFKRQAAPPPTDDEDDDEAPWKHCPMVACPGVVCSKPGPQDCHKHEDCGEGKKCCTFCCWTRKCH